MADYVRTPNYQFYKPTPGVDDDQWGDHQNWNFDTIDSSLKSQSDGLAGGPWLPIVGGTLTGMLTLSGNATLPMHAVPLQQLNAATAGAPFLPLSGGTVTGTTYFHSNMAFVPTTTQFGLYAYGDMSGQMGNVGLSSLFNVLVPNNSVDSTANVGNGFWAAGIQHNFGGTKGGQGSLAILQNQTADLLDTSPTFMNALNTILTLNHSGAGMASGIAEAPEVRVAGAGWGLIEAFEPAVDLNAGAGVQQAYVATYVWNAAAHAVQMDAFAAYTTGAGNAVAPRSIWQIGRNDSQWPVDPAGWLMTSVQQINNNPGSTARWPQACAGGLDFSKINFSTAAIRSSGVSIESAAFKVGTGRISENSAGLVIDAPGSVGAIASVSAGGTGYQVNDQLYDGLGGILRVTTIGGGGAITAAGYIAGKEPYYFGTGPVSVTTTGGSGNGAAAFNVTWTALNRVTISPSGGITLVNGTLDAAADLNVWSGAFVLGSAANSFASLIIQAANGTNRTIGWFTGGSSAAQQRWTLGASNTGEGGANAGSDFWLSSFSDTGVALGTPVTITRATGAVQLWNGLGLFGHAPATARPTVSGLKGSNAALASLLTALVSYGLITDSTGT